LGRAGQEQRSFDLQALRAGSAAREDEQIPRMVPRAAPAAARLAVSACSRPRARLLDSEELRIKLELLDRRFVELFPALAQALVQTPA
jgi:hypothetical protein